MRGTRVHSLSLAKSNQAGCAHLAPPPHTLIDGPVVGQCSPSGLECMTWRV